MLTLRIGLAGRTWSTVLLTEYTFKDVDSCHRLLRMAGDTQLAAQCRLPIGSWQCIFKDTDGVVYNANTDNTFTRIN